MQNGTIIVKPATLSHVTEIVKLAARVQRDKKAHKRHPLNEQHFMEYVSACIASPGIYVFISEEEDNVKGLFILNEFSCPWNRKYVWASDLMFIAEKGGPKLIRLARKMKESKGWDKLMLSTTTTNKRADKFYSHYGDRIGSVFEIK